MSPTSSFTGLMIRLENRDDEAAYLVYERFAGKLIAAVQEQLSRKYAAKIEAESVVLSALGSFFGHCAAGNYRDRKSWEELWALLLTMAKHKLIDRVRQFQAACRDVDREVSLDALREQAGAFCEPVDRNPTPAAVALLADQVECLFRSFVYDHPGFKQSLHQVIALRLQGYTSFAPDCRHATICAATQRKAAATHLANRTRRS